MRLRRSGQDHRGGRLRPGGCPRGRRACVVTIDPARRLADALGLDTLTNAPTQIEGRWPGELYALMLDPKGTFDDLVHRYCGTRPSRPRTSWPTGIYRNLTGALSGTQEYMAMEKLYELVEEGGFDLVVVDTPPSRNALDFLDAPRRLTRFLENRLFQALMMPTRAGAAGRGRWPTQALLRTISKVAGADIVQDAVAFFQAFEGMEEGFRQRGRPHETAAGAAHHRLPPRDLTARPDTVDEAGWFADKLNESGLAVEGLVVNRVHPSFSHRMSSALPQAPEGSALEALVENLRRYAALNECEESALAELVLQVAPSPVARVPLLDIDVTDTAGLAMVADQMFGNDGGARDGERHSA